MQSKQKRWIFLFGLIVFTILLLGGNALFFYQDMLGDDFWGGNQAPSLRLGQAAHWFYDVSAGALKCPAFIGRGQTLLVNQALKNRTDTKQIALVYVFFSSADETQSEIGEYAEFSLLPQETLRPEWQIGAENIGEDGTIRVRTYVGNKAANAFGAARACTVRYLQIGPVGGNLAGYGIAFLLLVGFWYFWVLVNKAYQMPRKPKADRDAWKGSAGTLTLISLINFFGSGMLTRFANLFAILVLAVLILRPNESLRRVN
jgi:hypothetical protein